MFPHHINHEISDIKSDTRVREDISVALISRRSNQSTTHKHTHTHTHTYTHTHTHTGSDESNHCDARGQKELAESSKNTAVKTRAQWQQLTRARRGKSVFRFSIYDIISLVAPRLASFYEASLQFYCFLARGRGEEAKKKKRNVEEWGKEAGVRLIEK